MHTLRANKAMAKGMAVINCEAKPLRETTPNITAANRSRLLKATMTESNIPILDKRRKLVSRHEQPIRISDKVVTKGISPAVKKMPAMP